MLKKYFVEIIFLAIVVLLFQACIASKSNKYTIESQYSKDQRVYLEVYCEDEFDFKKAGEIKGSFQFSRQTDFNVLSFDIIVPILFHSSLESENLFALVDIPAKIIYEWDGKDGKRKRAETQLDPKGPEARSFTYDGQLFFNYIPLPRNKKIDYTLIFGQGKYLKDRHYPLLYGLTQGKEGDNRTLVVDKTELLKTDPRYWKAKFMIVTGRTKGFTGLKKQKPARD